MLDCMDSMYSEWRLLVVSRQYYVYGYERRSMEGKRVEVRSKI